ncbi:MAG: response regulator transcription factor [Coriobacteriales bacterium]|nr:response regulator transcription factor [Coriobacteriales bacterium]
MRIVLADDHAVVRSGFAMIIGKQMDMEVVGMAADGLEAYRVVGQAKPHVLITDISMPPGEGGISLIAKVAENLPQVKIIALTMYNEQEYLSRVLKIGARGYVLKNSSDEELLKAIRAVHDGEVYLDPAMMTGFFDRYREGTDGDGPQCDDLTEREREIVSLVAHGYANKEIAEQLFVSVKTIESQKARIMKKLGVETRPKLVEYALKKGILR